MRTVCSDGLANAAGYWTVQGINWTVQGINGTVQGINWKTRTASFHAFVDL
jgi:hypothetical protein